MDFGDLLVRAARLVWRQKALWVIGLLPALTQVVTAVLQTAFFRALRDDLLPLLQNPVLLSQPEVWLMSPEVWGGLVNGRFLIVGLFWLFLSVIVFWLILTLAEAAVIAATLAAEAGHVATVRSSLTSGWRWLGRLIAIDALVFFPWFVVALLVMVLALVVLLAAVALSAQQAAVEAIGAMLAAGLGCVLLLACLLVPVGFVSRRFRALAFRDTAVFAHSVRGSVHHTWQVVRRNVTDVLILVGLLWGVHYIAGLVIGFVAVPLGLVTAVPTLLNLNTPFPAGSWLIGLGTAVLLAIPRSLLFVYVAVVWTLGYLRLSNRHRE